MIRLIHIIQLIFTLTNIPVHLLAQSTSTIAKEALRNNTGLVLFESGKATCTKTFGFGQVAINKECTNTINGIRQDSNSFNYFLDNKENQNLETNQFGIPKSSFGFADNATSIVGHPSFERTYNTFNVDTSQKINVWCS